ncbi:unnamed protein product [Durusdinium trenchii]|uniref:EF-hand domain-containing protein n=1 Tax=Durusdinium trenchii TaxID=1381693 RepID=A0ABP0P8S1_9DINO
MALPKLPNLIEEPSENSPFAEIEAKLDRIAEQVDHCLACLSEASSRSEVEARRFPRTSLRLNEGVNGPGSFRSEEPHGILPNGHEESSRPRRPSNFSMNSFVQRPPSKTTTTSRAQNSRMGSKNSRVGAGSSVLGAGKSIRGSRLRERSLPADLQSAWQKHAQTLMTLEVSRAPLLRLQGERSRWDSLWELLDDPDSSRPAYWISQFLKVMVITGLVISQVQTGEEPMISAHLAACVETTFDVVFFVEFCCRIMTAPSKRSYVLDPLNWADLFSAAGLPLRASVGFLVYPALQEKRNVQLILLLFLPIVRFLKLLRYFETFRLLIHAARSAIDALPVLVYIMIVITLVAATAIYLVESRGNIPTMHHSLWLAIVTMTTVGYGDYYPTSLLGYIAASILTFVSVLFLALPVGIIGNEFTACWQSRHQVLLKTRVRKCLLKWGYTARDLQVLIQYVDVDEDGFLTLSEFLELIQQMRVGISLEHAVDLFILFDTDQNGQIDHAEFLRQIFPEEYVQDATRQTIQNAGQRINDALQHLEAVRRSDSTELE